jgi:hypothetical protein
VAEQETGATDGSLEAPRWGDLPNMEVR